MIGQPLKNDAGAFYPETHFELLARRPGGPTRERALAAAQTQLEKLEPDFAKWLNAQLRNIKAALAEVDESSTTLPIERAFRACSYLRDVGATMGYGLVTFVAKTLCDVLESVIAGAPYDKETIARHVDALVLAAKEQYRNMTPEQFHDCAQDSFR